MTLSPASAAFPSAAAVYPTMSRVPEPAQAGPRDAKAWKQAQDFEQVFVEQMLGHLTSGLSGPGPLGDEGPGSDVWRGMLTQEYAKNATKAGGFGIAPAVYNELMRLQEKSHGPG
jgi:peptidoglycan hydrolase FlgJ